MKSRCASHQRLIPHQRMRARSRRHKLSRDVLMSAGAHQKWRHQWVWPEVQQITYFGQHWRIVLLLILLLLFCCVSAHQMSLIDDLWVFVIKSSPRTYRNFSGIYEGCVLYSTALFGSGWWWLGWVPASPSCCLIFWGALRCLATQYHLGPNK